MLPTPSQTTACENNSSGLPKRGSRIQKLKGGPLPSTLLPGVGGMGDKGQGRPVSHRQLPHVCSHAAGLETGRNTANKHRVYFQPAFPGHAESSQSQILAFYLVKWDFYSKNSQKTSQSGVGGEGAGGIKKPTPPKPKYTHIYSYVSANLCNTFFPAGCMQIYIHTHIDY